ncbi:hypothetical protein ACI2LO_20915 [Streptomyces sp. NPDC033754]|uniref:hypothetical protein n=1 Tax=Streptomyces sp. NPDC033754 TaxID=3365318 RepID=UPI00384BC38D
MSQEAAPERAVPEQSAPQSVPVQKDAGAPKGLLQQMEELMAALSADLSQLDADIQSSADRLESEPAQPGPAADYPAAERPATGHPAAEHDGSAPHRSDLPAPEHRDAHQDRSDQRGHGAEHREDAGHEPDTRPASGDATRHLF